MVELPSQFSNLVGIHGIYKILFYTKVQNFMLITSSTCSFQSINQDFTGSVRIRVPFFLQHLDKIHQILDLRILNSKSKRTSLEKDQKKYNFHLGASKRKCQENIIKWQKSELLMHKMIEFGFKIEFVCLICNITHFII